MDVQDMQDNSCIPLYILKPSVFSVCSAAAPADEPDHRGQTPAYYTRACLKPVPDTCVTTLFRRCYTRFHAFAGTAVKIWFIQFILYIHVNMQVRLRV